MTIRWASASVACGPSAPPFPGVGPSVSAGRGRAGRLERLGRYAAALIDPRRPESASLVVLATSLFAVAWLWAGFTAWLLVRGEPLLFDHDVQAAMFALRNPAVRLAVNSSPVNAVS